MVSKLSKKSIEGLNQIQSPVDDLPPGFDAGVLLACRDLGIMFEQGISELEFRLNHRSQAIKNRYTITGYNRIQERIQGPVLNIRTIEGRLLMADFKEHGTRCRIHPSYGDPIICLFNESQRNEVLENIFHFVRVIGEAREDPTSGKITSIQLHDIQCLENREQECRELLPQGTNLPLDFWQAPSLDDLAQAQGVQPLPDVNELFGTWPGDPDDEFEKIVNNLRKRNVPMEFRP